MKNHQFLFRSSFATLTMASVLGFAGCSGTPPEGNVPPERPFTQEERDASIREINANRGGYGDNIPGAPKNAGKNMSNELGTSKQGGS